MQHRMCIHYSVRFCTIMYNGVNVIMEINLIVGENVIMGIKVIKGTNFVIFFII